jgi:hypothetical protein
MNMSQNNDKGKKRLSFLEMHSSNSQHSDSDTSDTDYDDEAELPKICGKIGKRASRFSLYGQVNTLLDYQSYIKKNPKPAEILEENESETLESPRSLFAKDYLKNSTVSESQLNDSSYSTIKNKTVDHLSGDETPMDDEKLARSKYQEKLLNKALQSCSKFSLDGSNVLKQSNFKQSHNAIVETGFGKKENVISKDSLNDSNQKTNHMNRISIENQLSGFKPRQDEYQVEDLANSPIPQDKIDTNQMGIINQPFNNIHLPKNIFSKKGMNEVTYRDSCDVNVEGNKSVIKFYEHWKLKNQQNDQNNPKTGFDPTSIQASSIEKTNLGKVVSSHCSEDSNYYDIFSPKYDSSSQNDTIKSDKKSSFLSKSKLGASSLIISKNKPKNDTDSKISNNSKSDSSTKSNGKSLFKQYSQDSKFGKNLLSDMMSQTVTKSKINKLITDTGNRDSIFDEPLNFNKQNKEPVSGRNSAYYNSQIKRESRFVIDDKIKKKYSMVGSKLVEEGKESSQLIRDSTWDDPNSQSKLVNMLSITSNLGQSLDKKSTMDFKLNEDLLLDSMNSISTKKSVDRQKSAENMLFVKKKEGKLTKLKSDLSDSKQEEKEDQNNLQPKNPEFDITDNKRSLFDISREPGELTNLLRKEKH